MKKTLSLLLALIMLLGLCACDSSRGYGVKSVVTLVEQEYSIAFRNDDPKSYYVIAAIQVLAAEGRVDELSIKWLGGKLINFKKNAAALDGIQVPAGLDLIIGVDPESFPMVYVSNNEYWGHDIELALSVAERLGWTLKIQPIDKVNVYDELYSGNIDCAWGGVAIDQKDVEEKKFTQFGPYIHNDIVIAARDSSAVWSSARLKGRSMAMPATQEAMEALKSNGRLLKRLGQVTRLVGGTIECFEYLFSGKCDAVLTDSTAILYYNCH